MEIEGTGSRRGFCVPEQGVMSPWADIDVVGIIEQLQHRRLDRSPAGGG